MAFERIWYKCFFRFRLPMIFESTWYTLIIKMLLLLPRVAKLTNVRITDLMLRL